MVVSFPHTAHILSCADGLDSRFQLLSLPLGKGCVILLADLPMSVGLQKDPVNQVI